jgi:N-acetylmuramoyl-L-alanine amidase
VRQTPMRVLTGANMPAVVVEMGYLSNPDQERSLASSDFQTRMVEALSDAVIAFRRRLEQGPADKPVDRAAAPGSPAAPVAR